MIQAGVDAGEFKQGIDNARIALSIIAMIEGAVMMSKVTGSQSCLDKIMYSVELMINDMKA